MKSCIWTYKRWLLVMTLALMEAACTVERRSVPHPEAASTQAPTTRMEPAAVNKLKIQATYGKLPLHFEANQGQSDAQVKFLSRGHGYSLHLTPTEAVLQLRNADLGVRNEKSGPPSTTSENPPSTLHNRRSCGCNCSVPIPTRGLLA
jgi:hypothetical protein